jgi:hypothetical protein
MDLPHELADHRRRDPQADPHRLRLAERSERDHLTRLAEDERALPQLVARTPISRLEDAPLQQSDHEALVCPAR